MTLRNALKKNPAWRSNAYLAFVRTRPCVVTGSDIGVVAHHVRAFGHGGMSMKPPDWLCLPLTAEEHAKLHHEGENHYWRTRGHDPVSLLTMTMLVYLAQRPSYDLLEALGDIVAR